MRLAGYAAFGCRQKYRHDFELRVRLGKLGDLCLRFLVTEA